MKLLEISKINKEVVSLENEPFGFINKSNLTFAISQYNKNKFLDKYSRIAILIRNIAQGHPFIEGNKRTAYIVLKTLLVSINRKFRITKKQQEDFIVLVAKGKYNDIDKFKSYLMRNTKKY